MDQSKHLIKKNRLKLVDWLCLDKDLVLQHVQSEEIITDAEYGKLKSISDPNKANSELIDMLLGKGEDTCAKFLRALNDDRIKNTYPDLAKWLASSAGSGPSTDPSADFGSRITDKRRFLEKNRAALIKSVKNTSSILDHLKEEGFHSEMISEAEAERTKEAQMRLILNRITVERQAEILFKALQMHEEDVLKDLIAKYQQ
ncbi:uncharacterized protein si:dkey-10c21.1 [Sardina pilchardus]|uniref:uncharacterized protein si:dkey-10c21.1 n=1 Tax=Sardina pilchardus TaxID=27697 RepID=UPI002E103F2E